MMSLDDVQRLFGTVLGTIYMDASLVVFSRSGVRDPVSGEFPKQPVPNDVKVQKDECTNRQMSEAGYSAKDVRFMVLQSGVGVVPDTDAELHVKGTRYMVMSVSEDPYRVYWDLRCREVPQR